MASAAFRLEKVRLHLHKRRAVWPDAPGFQLLFQPAVNLLESALVQKGDLENPLARQKARDSSSKAFFWPQRRRMQNKKKGR